MPGELRLIFAGTPDFAAHALRALADSRHRLLAVYTQPDRPAGRGRKLQASPVKLFAQQRGIAVYQPDSFKSDDARQQLADLKPDLMVVAAYGLILPQAVLDIPRLGCINIHASLLPRWRGAAPIQRAILAGDDRSGVTIMQMAAGLDTGDMLLKKECPIEAADTASTLHDRLAALGADAVIEAIERLVANHVTAEPQDPALATYANKLQKAEAVLDWAQPAPQLARQVRAFNPWPVAYTPYQGNNLRVWDAHALGEQSCVKVNKPAGCVIAASQHGIDVATGDGVLRITRLQLPGGKPLAAKDFVNAHDMTSVCFNV